MGPYELLEAVGRGGMGTVYRGRHRQTGHVVAIKVMAAQLATNAAARRWFTREAQAQAAVSHDHVVTIHAVDGDGSRPYLVMQYVAGLSLQQRLRLCDLLGMTATQLGLEQNGTERPIGGFQ